jgi:hypothetical protein
MECDMTRGINRFRFLTALAVFGAMVAGGSEAQAKGVVITTGGVQGVGEPFYDYTFDVYLSPGTALVYGDSFTVTSLIGVSQAPFYLTPPGIYISATTSQPGGPLVGDLYTFVASISTVSGSNPVAANVTWFDDGLTPIVNNTSSNQYLGQFIVNGNVDLPDGVSGTTMVTYGSTTNPVDSNGSVSSTSVTVPPGSPNGPPPISLTQGAIPPLLQVASVPEPSSVILLLIGGAVLPYFVQRRRH